MALNDDESGQTLLSVDKFAHEAVNQTQSGIDGSYASIFIVARATRDRFMVNDDYARKLAPMNGVR